MTERRRTSTSNFGVGRREAHDARAFYARFEAPELSDDETVAEPRLVAEPFVLGDARQMDTVADNSVALVVTSPPYFAGKQYEEELNREGIPSSYGEYLQLLEDVFSECVRTLEPGGRIAVNVANLGRKPYRSLAADVITILQDKLHLLLRGEVVWQKGEGASGSCAWGSFRSASNPVLRDLTERVVIASKGRFSRAKSLQERTRLDLPHRNTIKADDFAAYTLDVWNVPPESARRVNHPAPFPVELPARLIELYTYEDDLVLDPFMGSGSTLVAADGLDRRYVGYDLDPTYVELARQRVADERVSRQAVPNPGGAEKAKARGKGTQKGGRPAGKAAGRGRKDPPAEVEAAPEDFQARASREGKAAQVLAEELLIEAGFVIGSKNQRIPRTGVVINFVAEDKSGNSWYFDVSGAFTTHRGGLQRTDTVWKTLGRAHVLTRQSDKTWPLVFLTSHLPKPSSEGDIALRAAGPQAFFDAICMLKGSDLDRLRLYAAGCRRDEPIEGFWTDKELNRD
jgi:site-specific DNA-methyltransferase (adenine-specific)